jgi:RHS repeat-associated protein
LGNPDKTVNAAGEVLGLEWSGRQLARVTHADNSCETYTYDADGLRTSRRLYDAGGALTRSHEYTWVDGVLIGRKSGNDVMHFSEIGFNLNGVQYFYVKNLQGDVTKLVGANGTIVANYAYDAWGGIITASGAMAEINPIRYRGYYYDTETQLYYCQSRYYNAVFGRWVSADDIGVAQLLIGEIGGTSLFTYCVNNCTNKVDPEGFLALSSTLTNAKFVEGNPKEPNWPETDFYDWNSRKATFASKALKSSIKVALAALRKSKKSVLKYGTGLDAFERYLDNTGRDRNVNYSNAYNADAWIKYAVNTYLRRAQIEAERIIKQRTNSQNYYYIYGSVWAKVNYTATTEWTYAIGQHRLWAAAKVTYLPSSDSYYMTITIHMRDKYNFNKGMKDIIHGIKDDTLGQLESAGLAKQYWQKGSISKTMTWKRGKYAKSPAEPTQKPLGV